METKVAPKDPRWKLSGTDVPEKLRHALEDIDYMPNAVASWVEAHGGNRTLASSNAKKIQQAQDLLAEVLASLPAAVEYTVIGDGILKFKTREELIHGMAKFNVRHVGDTPSGGNMRPELRGQPRFDSLVGPMYGGPGLVRYESGEVNDRLSR